MEALGLLELPHPRYFPVILAARMSLSFPLLFAALLLAMIATEILLSRRLRQWHSALQPTLAQPQMQQGEGPVGTIQR